MSTKRMRVFAGPNGSGETTIINDLKAEIPFGVYVNADDIEGLLKQSGVLLFSTYQLNITEAALQSFLKKVDFPLLKEMSLIYGLS